MMANEKFICLGCPSKACDHHKAPEPTGDDPCEWNGRVISKFHEFADFSGGHRCIKCKKEYIGHSSEHAEPKAPTGDDMHETPGDIEVEYRYKTSEEAKLLPLPLQLKRLEVINRQLCHNHNTLLIENANLERQLKAEIAAKNQFQAELAFAGDVLGEVCVAGTIREGEKLIVKHKHAAVAAILSQITRVEKAEKERDAALDRGNKLEAIYDNCHAREIELLDDLKNANAAWQKQIERTNEAQDVNSELSKEIRDLEKELRDYKRALHGACGGHESNIDYYLEAARKEHSDGK